MDKSISRAEQLARIGRENDLAELEYEDADVKIHLTFEAPPAPLATQGFDPAFLASLTSHHAAPAAPAASVVNKVESSNAIGETINSPLAGVFYRAPRPDAEPFVSESAQVSTGQALCIVEAMKLMNEITAERPCKISKILVQNGEAVEEGQALFLIE